MLPSIAWAQAGVPEGMKTSESYAAIPATPCHHPRPARAAQRRHVLWSRSASTPRPPPSACRYTNLQQISPETTGTLGAGTMSSRSRPVTGIVLLEEVTESGKKKEGVTISAELVLDGGVAATATFEAAPGYDLRRDMTLTLTHTLPSDH